MLVLLSHSHRTQDFPENSEPYLRWLPDGGFGVEVFFVISGFLITWLLLQEKQESDRISLSRFYARRALRILPAYSVFLVALLLMTMSTPFFLHWGQWLRLLTFTSNFTWQTLPGYNPWPIGHTWTLALEEQFYLLWPVVVSLLFGSVRSPNRLLIACSVLILACPLARVLTYFDIGGIAFSEFSFLVKGDSIAWGCALAIVYVCHREKLDDLISRFRGWIAVSALTAILVPLVLTRLFLLGVITVPLTQTLNAIGIASLILLSIKYPNAGPFKALNWRPVMQIGVWSYSIYLWQQLFCTHPSYFGLDTAPWYLSFPFWFVPAILAGVISYYAIEKPFLGLRSKFR